MPAKHGGTPGTRRIAVIGRAGAGKTTVARALAEALDLPLVHLDQLAWGPGWRPADPLAFDERHAAAVARDAWVLDGGYLSRAGWPERVARADVIVLVQAPLPVCLWRIVRRGLRRSPAPRPDLPAGCKDEVNAEFLFWTVTWARRTRAVLAPLRAGVPGMPPVVRIRRGEDPVAALDRAWALAERYIRGAGSPHP